MLPPVSSTLAGSSAVSAIVGDRIWRHGNAGQDTGRPYVTWQVISGVPQNQLSGLPGHDQITIQVDCWHQTDEGVVQLAEACRNAIEPEAHMTSFPVNLREPATKLFRISLQFDWWLPRSLPEPTS